MNTEQKKKITNDVIALTFEKINADYSWMEKVRSNLNIFETQNKLHMQYVNMWKKLIKEKSLQFIMEKMQEDTDNGELLRSTSPFIGIVTAEERNTIIRRHLGRFKP